MHFRNILVLFLTTVFALHAQQETPALRSNGSISFSSGVGTISGAHVGIAYFPVDGFSLESSVGYVRLAVRYDVPVENPLTKLDAFSVTIGGNVFMYPDNELSPYTSLLFSFTGIPDKSKTAIKDRLSMSITMGTEYYFLSSLCVYLRFGPTCLYFFASERHPVEFSFQFDAGLSWTL